MAPEAFLGAGVGAEPILFQSFPYCAEADANAIITVPFGQRFRGGQVPSTACASRPVTVLWG
jgi:hypothetical protein